MRNPATTDTTAGMGQATIKSPGGSSIGGDSGLQKGADGGSGSDAGKGAVGKKLITARALDDVVTEGSGPLLAGLNIPSNPHASGPVVIPGGINISTTPRSSSFERKKRHAGSSKSNKTALIAVAVALVLIVVGLVVVYLLK
jgi:hypothetical protein